MTIVMSEASSEERRGIMRAYGADLELVEGDISQAKERADEIEREDGAAQLRQFENPANPGAHYHGTGVEIIEQVGDREIDALVAGVGTGGTLTGTARRLRETFPDMEVVAVEPAENAVLSAGESGADDFQGMGPGFVSPNLDTDLVDSIETVRLADAERECRRLAREEGILAGQSSGASSLAARRVASRLAVPEANCPPAPAMPRTDDSDLEAHETSDTKGRTDTPTRAIDGSTVDPADAAYEDCPLVVTVFWDSGERYLSTGLFD